MTRTDLPSLTATLPTRSSATDGSTQTEPTSGRPTSEEPSSLATTSTRPTSEAPSTDTTSVAPSRSKTTPPPVTDTTSSTSPATASRSTEPTETAGTTEAAGTTGGAATAEKGNGGENGEEGSSSVWWWLAALAAVGAVAAAAIGVRARSRARWQEQLDAARSEARWFADELLPQLQRAESAAELTGGWQVGAPRVASAEDQLTGLAAGAPGEERQQRSLALRDAVRTARQTVEGVIAGGDPGTASEDLQGAAARLSEALAADQRR